MRTETDYLGTVELEDSIYYGISTYRAIQNFDVSNQFVHKDIVYELVNIKKQAAKTNHKLGYLDKEMSNAIIKACDDILRGKYDDSFVVNKFQGGAGTSTNMNVNEVIANVALHKMGEACGSYDKIHPINHINLHQSTNDTFPTAVKIACIKKIRILADEYALLQKTFQELEEKNGHIIKLGRTEMMDAVPILAGQMFGAYAETFSRDRWRIYKTEERLRSINIGGTAIGTGLNAPLKYTFLMTSLLQESTNIGLSRAENLIDNTQNLDAFNEVSALIKVSASTLIKVSNDLRFLASGPMGGIGEIILKDNQVGSSIMPGKVNPVILEMVIQNANRVISNDLLVTNLVSQGNLELNAFVPMIGETLLESLELMIHTVNIFNNRCAKYIEVDEKRCLENLQKSYSLITPLITLIGYDKASEIVKKAQHLHVTITDVLLQENLFTKEQLDIILNPFNITKPGIIKDVKQ